MSKIKITGRSERTSALQNITLRTDLGSKLRKVLYDQRPKMPALVTADYAALEMRVLEQYDEMRKRGVVVNNEALDNLVALYGDKRGGRG